jgi:thiamine biosynthesis lipoprotein
VGSGPTLRASAAAGSPVPLRGSTLNVTPDIVEQFRSMACDVTIRVVEPTRLAWPALEQARAVFVNVERACTRFDATSPLMQANADPQAWHEVPAELFEAVAEAQRAHTVTGGLFDPRVLRILEDYGYDRSLPFASGRVHTPGPTAPAGAADSAGPEATVTSPWRPELDAARSAVRLGAEPIDLGGIGKGLAVRWAAERLADAGSSVLLEAGGDCYLRGIGPEQAGWRIGIEDPWGGEQPVAVLRLVDLACATSSIRLRAWRSGDAQVHHLIDPRTRRPGGAGLRAVTVVGPDPALAEVWSKALFLSGTAAIDQLAQARGLAALWIHDDGRVGTTRAMDDLVIWRGDDVG